MPEHPLTKDMAEFTLPKKEEGVPIARNSFIQMTKLSNVKVESLIYPVMQSRKISMLFMRLRSENSGGNLPNAIRKNL